MKILIDENIPYVEHFFHDYLDDIEYFKDKEFEINTVSYTHLTLPTKA